MRPSKTYKQTWHDRVRDFANICFMASYLLLLYGIVLPGATIAIIGELGLIPHSMKIKSYTTLAMASFFIIASFVRILTITT